MLIQLAGMSHVTNCNRLSIIQYDIFQYSIETSTLSSLLVAKKWIFMCDLTVIITIIVKWAVCRECDIINLFMVV